MKKSFIKLAGAFLLAFALSIVAHATSISGNINFTGGVYLDNSLGAATKVNSWKNTIVLSADGDFLANGVDFLTPAVFTAPWSFTSGALASLWTATGTKTFTFDLTSSWITKQNVTNLDVAGTGWVSAPGFDPTQGTWEFSSQTPGTGTPPKFSFSAATGTTIPDGGTTALLLGLGLLGVAGVARRFKSVKA